MNGNSTARTFADKPAVREATPLLLGLIGPSGSGKTYSALRLATGIQRVSGGDIYVIDTEARRALHYAERFKFRHLQFDAPFGSLDYLAAIQHCVAKGAKTIIVDSMSHEHEGPGGVLEQHALETKRLAALWKCSEEKAQMSAWSGPKGDRRRMINTILQLNANMIFCFRAKEKIKLGGAKPEDMGFMPIAGEEFVYEMVLKCLLLPGANGVPTWQSAFRGERMMMKLPEQFLPLFKEERQLDEEIGKELAEWAAGVDSSAEAVNQLVADYEKCVGQPALDALEKKRLGIWRAVPTETKTRLKAVADAAKARLGNSPAPATPTPASTTPVEQPKETAASPPPAEPPDPEEAKAIGRASKTIESLVDSRKSVWALYAAVNAEVPIEVQSVFDDRKAALEQEQEY